VRSGGKLREILDLERIFWPRGFEAFSRLFGLLVGLLEGEDRGGRPEAIGGSPWKLLGEV
jgi:hypothetical protein